MSQLGSRSRDVWLRTAGLDEIVEAFEDHWSRTGQANVSEWLPVGDHPQATTIALELLCVDLERRVRAGTPRSVESYCDEFLELLGDEALRERLAFEDYRVRTARGDQPQAADYARRLAIDTAHWPPTDSRTEDSAAGVTPGSSVTGDGQTRQRDYRPLRLPSIGERFLDFELLETLGTGSFGHVYLARQVNLAGRPVVLKITTEQWSDSDQLARLQHTHIVPVYSVHRAAHLQAICMPYRGRRTLRDVLRGVRDRTTATSSCLLAQYLNRATDVGPAPCAETPSSEIARLHSLSFDQLSLWIVARLCDGLQHAHDRGLLHRDLKPANILLADDGQPMILDFNLSQDRQRSAGAATLMGGTYAYMSPEQRRALHDGGTIDERSDLFAMGCLLHELLTGEPPSHDAVDLRRRLRQSRPGRPCAPAVEAIVLKCLSPDPADRYPSAQALREDLERQLSDLPLRHARDRSLWERVGKWCRRHPRLTSGSGVGLVAAVLLMFTVSWIAMESRRSARLEALSTFDKFQRLAQDARISLSLPLVAPHRYDAGRGQAQEAVALYVSELTMQLQRPAYRRLPAEVQQQVRQGLQELYYLLANSHLQQAHAVPSESQRRTELQLAARYCAAAIDTSEATPIPAAVAQQQRAIAQLQTGTPVESLRSTRPPAGPPLTWRDRYLFAVQSVTHRDFAAAIAQLESLCAERPSEFAAWFLLGTCHDAVRDWIAADSCFTTCIALWPTSELAYFQRGVCRYRLERLTDAEHDFGRVLAIRPGQDVSLLNRGLVRLELQRFTEAEADLTRAIEAGRDDSFVYLLRARARVGLARTTEAMSDLELGLQREPIDEAGWIERSLQRLPTDPAGALQDLDAALQLNPDSPQALQNRVHVLADRLDRPDEALASLERWLSVDPDNPTAIACRGLFRARGGQAAAGIADGQYAVSLAATAETYYQLACIWALTAGDSDARRQAALRALRAAIARDERYATLAPSDPDLQSLAQRPEFLDATQPLSSPADVVE